MTKLFIQEPKRIIRTSDHCDFGEGLQFEILMTSPVQQGHIVSGDRTRVLIVDLSDSTTEQENLEKTGSTDLFNMTTTHQLMEPKEFNVVILQKSWPEARLYPPPHKSDDDTARIFVNIKDLADCGVFSGDWVLVSANEPKKSRLCRVFGIDSDQR